MSLKYEPASEPLHISVEWFFSNAPLAGWGGAAERRARKVQLGLWVQGERDNRLRALHPPTPPYSGLYRGV